MIILDLFIILFIFWSIYSCAKKGFVYTVANLVITLGSLVFAVMVSPMIAEAVYGMGLRDSILELANDNFAYFINIDPNMFVGTLQDFFTTLPNYLQSVLSDYTVANVEYFSEIGAVSLDTTALIDGVMLNLIDPAVLGFLSVIATIIVFFLLRIVGAFILPIFKIVNEIPIIGTLNSFLGALSGVLIGGVHVYIFVLVIGLLNILLGNSITFFSLDWLGDTILFEILINTLPWR